jgi:GNAT superfamily N-acetyltransferase
VVFTAPELVETEPIEVLCEVEVALELQRGVLTGRMVGGEEGSETHAGHDVMVGSGEIGAPTGPGRCNDLAVGEIEVRPAVEDDVTAISRVIDAQDTAWWGVPDGDITDVRDELGRVELMVGSLEVGSRVMLVDGELVGVALMVGHGHTSVAVDPTIAVAAEVRLALFEWAASFGDVEIVSPAQDADRLAELASIGFEPRRSSFELERPGDVSDLPTPIWPSRVAAAPFRLGADDEELHEMIYSFWTDVPGHTSRPIDEWRTLLLTGPWFDADLVVVARAADGTGPIVGCALGRTYTGNVGWVSQLGVARSARGLGLGRAVLLEACHRLGRKEPRMIGLGVEAENANALGLYRSVGMDVAREWVHCQRR